MKTSYRLFSISLLGLSSFLLSINSFADLGSSYQCTRTAPDNTTTSSPLTITKTGDTYTLQWLNPNGFPAAYGTGVTYKNSLAIAYWDSKNANVFGGELLVIMPDNSLSGTWALQSTNQVGTETCKKS